MCCTGSLICVCATAYVAEAKKLSPEEAAGITIGIVLFGFFAAIVYFAVNTRNLREEAKEKRLMSEAVRVRSDMKTCVWTSMCVSVGHTLKGEIQREMEGHTEC